MSLIPKDTLLYRHLILILVLVNTIVLHHAFTRDKHWYPVLYFSGAALLWAIYKQLRVGKDEL